MRKKTLGRTGMNLPIVGLGAANLGLPSQASAWDQHVDNPDHLSYADFPTGMDTVISAVENGVQLIDTAPKYLYGDSERIIAQVFRVRPDLREKTSVTTKVGLVCAGDGFDYSYEAAMKSIVGSVSRLEVFGHFPTLYLHDPMGFDMKFVMSDRGVMGALRKLQRDGVVSFIGIAADEPEVAADYINTGEFDVATVSGAWILVNQKVLQRIIPAAKRHDVGLVATTVIERGLLVKGEVIPGVKYVQRDFTPELLAHVAKLSALCREFEVSLLSVALQWAVRNEQIAVVIPGARNPEEARMNALAGSEKIPDEFWEKLEPLIRHFDTRV